MTTKQTFPPSDKRRTAQAPRRAARVHAEPARALPVFELSFDVEPVVSVVRRHVTLSKEADEAITQELIEMLGRATVQLRTTDHKAAHNDDPVLTTEQAAQFVNVSRPYMAKLIDSGAVELHQKVGNQRRVLRSAVTRWQAAERTRQAKVLKLLSKDLDEEILSS
ncbi:helix-turn-helix domain-containing protein [Pollutimonas bauzanensis]|uniref:DNA binding domain-containing protein, excisionase family n=1 Tax=Pollutimonas bauzanensis TaxID=658167 RepID=A0A1M5Z2S6_9BURK|nr:helix-turn-helix domain-containing protein [Pollutimonas bauzanensis]SHI18542.1 DNA binding domain-containing protein, excisionase family [Pollutimonas bauzanensis]